MRLYYPSGSENGNSPRIQGQRHQAHHRVDNTSQSGQSWDRAPSEEEQEEIATALSSIDLDGSGSNDDEHNQEVNDSEDNNRLSSHASSSTSTDEESDENWDSLEYIR